jgi:predicted GNAT superfamily acetyltransferase
MPDQYSYVVKPVTEIEDLRRIVRLQRPIWGFSQYYVVPLNVFLVAAAGCGEVLGAYDGEGIVRGFLLSFLKADRPITEPSDRLRTVISPYVYMHMLGVCPEAQSRGLGYMLLMTLRERSLQKGLTRISWTYDPLVTANARLYLSKIDGTSVRSFTSNMYGYLRSGSRRKGQEPTDRCEVTWDLMNADNIAIGDAVNILSIDDDGSPHLEPYDSNARSFALHVPEDYVEMMERHCELALQWRFAVREAMLGLFGRGFHITRFVRLRDARGRGFGAYVFI